MASSWVRLGGIVALVATPALALRPVAPAAHTVRADRTAADTARLVARDWPSDGSPVPSVHASTIVEVGGTLVVAWFGGAYESARDVGIWLSRFENGRWLPPAEVAHGVQPDGTRVPTWNPVLDATGGARLVLYYKAGPNPREWWGLRRVSTDGGRTWSAAERLPDGVLGPIKNKPVRLSDGTLLSGSSTEAPDSANAWRVHFEWSRDAGRTWQRSAPPPAVRDVDAIQPALLVHRDGRVQALVRTRGPGRIYDTWSRDGGRTWSALAPTSLPNPNAGFDAVTLRSGRHVLVYNPVTEGRTPLVVATSADGVAWTTVATLEREPGEYSYPAVIEAADGTVHVTYTWKRTRIHHAVLRLP